MFGVIVRATGFGLIVFSLFDFVGLIMRVLGLPGHTDAAFESVLIAGGAYFLLGLAIICAADLIVRLAYGRPSN